MSKINPIYWELAAKIRCSNSKYIPQILAKLASLEQAKILLELPASSTEEIAERLYMDKERVDKLVEELYQKGCLYYSKTKGGIRFCQDVVELRDATTSNPRFDEVLGEDFFELWKGWTENEAPVWHTLLPPRPISPGRIMAQWKSIKDVPGVMPFDDVREVLRANANNLVINPCCCLRIMREPPYDTPEEICFVVRKTAEYSVDRGSGRKITVKEALDILESLERYAMVHTTWNQKMVRRLISNSDKRCLIFKWVPMERIRQIIAPSRFRATVDPEKCLGCKTCSELCLFDATKMRYYPEYGEERAYIDIEKCMGCGNCVLHCPIGATRMEVVRPPEFIPDLFTASLEIEGET